MKSFAYRAIVLASVLTMAASDPIHVVLRDGIIGPKNKTVDIGCYKAVNPFEDLGEYTWQSIGYCQIECLKLKKSVMALYKGSNCYCGDRIPADSDKAEAEECKLSCQGFPNETCGGLNAYNVHLTGLLKEKQIPVVGGRTSSQSTSTSTSSSVLTTGAGETIIITPTSSATPKGGSNKAGIAAGVVVGVIALGALIGVGFLYMKYKKRKEVEEEYRRNATISNFVSGGKPFNSQQSSMSDSRLDPAMMSQRRQSNGSIADDQDFSRRILKVWLLPEYPSWFSPRLSATNKLLLGYQPGRQ
ncbi:uncharacterized protein PADG_04943 [Paracoccidioides brasiliensis Pb18]|uniref:WSC domain-containing protein n=1 Tax=Paracoccidioides brasiliensis (strain Pb18) TaxID=502780 RepID=C1GBE2_PARBD|nr:uncharacterized protein PADG_04943 [Paracoccidioides brasiliensis Pb18]EEH48864.2 hypothetical protein PADG_04943 [Paracoccidioides brasiliensis Pb18]